MQTWPRRHQLVVHKEKLMRLMNGLFFSSLAAVFALSGCGDDSLSATATLKDKAGLAFGTVKFTQEKSGAPVAITIEVTTTSTHATAQDHGVHIHKDPKCDAPAFTSAMGHWASASNTMHGNPASGPHHNGDLGNLTIDANKRGKRALSSSEMSLVSGDPLAIVGLPVIVHEKTDDFTTQMPPGNAGARIACGLITLDP